MKTLKYHISVVAVLLSMVFAAQQAKAQYVQDINGRVYQTRSFTDVDGYPYMAENWVNGTVKMVSGKTYTDVPLKFNALDGNLYFKGKGDDEMLAFVEPVAEFSINYGNGPQRSVAMLGPDAVLHFYEVLANGPKKLLKQHVKEIREQQAYNGPTVKKFVASERYFITNGETLIPVKKDKKALLAAFTDKQTELEAYIKTNILDLKKDEDAAKLVVYYNSL